jgi:2,3-bisphosphoglycerate-independent phosphoglycerate mutase
MDRDRRWERTQRAYTALTQITEHTAPSALAAIEKSYSAGKTDEFIEPTIICDSSGIPYPRLSNHDAIIFYNYRIDRPRQLTRAFVLSNFEDQPTGVAFDPYAVKYYHKHLVETDSRNVPFKRAVTLPNLFFATMTEYERDLPCVVAFPPEKVTTPISSVFSELKLRQLHVSETEKERFVTYYFNGLREVPFPGEDRLIVPSPKVATYDLAPEMSSAELTQHLIDRISLGMYSFIIVNFANPDMVAHSGNIPASVRACEITDVCVGKIIDKVLEINGTCVITADHGNVEEMLGNHGEMDTEHSTYPVPFIMIDHALTNAAHALPKGKLADIAPTILAFRNYPIPGNMTGNNLLADISK